LPDLNAMRFDPSAKRGHVESWFLKATDPAAERAIWIKATIYAASSEPERPLVEGWAVAFDRRAGASRIAAVKTSLPFAEADLRRGSLGIAWNKGGDDRFAWSPGATAGAIATREHTISWDLRYHGEAPPIVPFPFEAMYTGAVPKQKLLTPVPDARFSGEITVDGERWDLDQGGDGSASRVDGGWRGMQGHNWGRGHSDRYAWAHVNQWNEDEPFVLEGFSGQIKLGPIMTPLTTIVCVRHRGVVYDFNQLRDVLRASGDVTHRRWDFACTSDHATIEGSIEAATEEMAGLHYANPDGAMTYCLNSKLARARVHFEAKGRPPLRLSSRAAALEIGTRDDQHGVRMLA
jgi:hypothetical protein